MITLKLTLKPATLELASEFAASEFAAWFKRDNDRFDVERFMLAVVGEKGK